MQKNLFNFVFTIALLFVITACVCRSDRDQESTPTKPAATATPDDTPTKASNSSQSDTVTSNKQKHSDDGNFLVEHQDVKNSKYAEIDRQVKDEKLLEKAADQLNRALILPHDITLITKDCDGDVNAYYESNAQSITVCYELMEHFYKIFKSAGSSDNQAYTKMFDAVRFVFLHEMGHALIDTYKLPVMSNEEDAADRCSAYINLKELGGDEGVRAVFAAADAFNIESKMNPGGSRNLADEHLLQEQRFYNSLCMVYGSDTDKYAYIVNQGYLPKERAVRCPSEYQRTVDSWIDLLQPWRKN
jgi:hypothetical protein